MKISSFNIGDFVFILRFDKHENKKMISFHSFGGSSYYDYKKLKELMIKRSNDYKINMIVEKTQLHNDLCFENIDERERFIKLIPEILMEYSLSKKTG